ncbi:MAG: ABC transporter permease [Cyclobacteriaceae bacterium]
MIQFSFLVVVMIYYRFAGISISLNISILLLPVLVLIMAILGLGAGIIFTSLTSKYRDLTFLLAFGVQLLMYATPVIYPMSSVPEKYKSIIRANPISSIVETFRSILLAQVQFNGSRWHIALAFLLSYFFLVFLFLTKRKKLLWIRFDGIQ